MDTDLLDLLDRLGEPRLLVLGDLMLDRFTTGAVERVCPEAPALILRHEGERLLPGGAARVALLAQALGARVSLVGVVGDDTDGNLLCGLLSDAGVDMLDVYIDPDRPTTVKQRFLGHSSGGPAEPLLRVDHESRAGLPSSLIQRLLSDIGQRLPACDAVLVADHAKGVCTPQLLSGALVAALERCVPVLVDPARGTDPALYLGAECLLPNRAEAAAATGREVVSIEDAVAAATDLLNSSSVPTVLLKLDADGMVVAQHGRPAAVYPSRVRRVADVTGAGDVVLATAGLCRANAPGWDAAARLASLAACLMIERPSCPVLTRDDLRRALTRHDPHGRSKLATPEQMEALAEDYRWYGKKVVLTNGCFDLLHAGHTGYLEEAASMGDVLVVAVNRDAAVRRLKGPGRPIVPERQRAAVVASLGCVDHVVLFDGDTPHELLGLVRPDVLVKGGDYSPDQVVGREVVLAYGGEVRVTQRREDFSTSRLVETVIRHTSDAPTVSA